MNAIVSGRRRLRDLTVVGALVVTAHALAAGGPPSRRLAGIALGGALPAGVAVAVCRRRPPGPDAPRPSCPPVPVPDQQRRVWCESHPGHGGDADDGSLPPGTAAEDRAPETTPVPHLDRASGLGWASGSGQASALSQALGLSRAAGVDQASGSGRVSGLGRASGLGRVSGLGRDSGLGRVSGVDQVSGLGRVSGSGRASGFGRASGPDRRPVPADTARPFTTPHQSPEPDPRAAPSSATSPTSTDGGVTPWRPADVVTFVRAVLAGCAFAAALRPTSLRDRRRTWAVAGFAIPALVLDAVDGLVARSTGTSHPQGARLDMETDAAVLLGLTVVLARTLTPNALVIGAARYVFVAGSLLRPAWAGELGPSRRRRIIAGLQGTALGVALAPPVPVPLAHTVIGTAEVLLLWSFAADITLLERRAARECAADEGTLLPADRPLPTPE